MLKNSASILLFYSVFIFSCNNAAKDLPAYVKPGSEEMVDVNRYLVQKDNERISSYIERKGLNMSQTGSGLWFEITKEGTGEVFVEGSEVTFDFETNLLDGTVCYSSEKTGPKEIVIGQSEIESGLNEGLQLLKPGSEAVFILQPYLAFGFLGDGNMIPARSVIVIKVKIHN